MNSSPILAAQYLESPYSDATPAAVRRHLRQACERLPISLVLLGWDISPALEEAVAVETQRQHAQLFRWQPLLTGDTKTDLPPEWATIGASGIPIPGHGGLPEFDFICPNHSAVADFLAERVDCIESHGIFQGLFLDRIRFPSPSLDPIQSLACFCEDCSRLAADRGLDLEYIRHHILSLPAEIVVSSLLGRPVKANSSMESFLDFRASSITRTVGMVARMARSKNLSIGLDCFSPALTRMVGQDLSSLDSYADWIKIMTYPRVSGPAGISFEMSGLANWLSRKNHNEKETMQLLEEASGLSLPANKAELHRTGLVSETISQEIRHGYELGVTNLLAGIALIMMDKIHESSPKQIQTDLAASRSADGIVISWDLWRTPLDYLDIIRNIWN